MEELEATVHRTWVQLLADHGYQEEAATAIDTDIHLTYVGNTLISFDDGSREWLDTVEVEFAVPAFAFGFINDSDSRRRIMERAVQAILDGRHVTATVHPGVRDPVDGEYFVRTRDIRVKAEHLVFAYRVKLIDVDEGWQEVVRRQIVSSSPVNQGNITEKLFARDEKDVLTYNEMKFASRSEIRIAQELERKKLLFFPLPLAVRADTGKQYADHREVDFLICNQGKWGILEVSFHDPGRYEKDKEKDAWFKKSGILCVEHYTAERCFRSPDQVVDEFLGILRQYER